MPNKAAAGLTNRHMVVHLLQPKVICALRKVRCFRGTLLTPERRRGNRQLVCSGPRRGPDEPFTTAIYRKSQMTLEHVASRVETYGRDWRRISSAIWRLELGASRLA
jgi:hypothetical protein